MSEGDKEESKGTFGHEVGSGFGCASLLVGLAILFSFPEVLKTIQIIFGHCK